MRGVIRTVGWVGLGCVALCLVASAVVIATAQVTHPRNETLYLRDVHRLTRADDGLQSYDAYVDSPRPSDQQLIEAGDRVCDWLARQPPALFITHRSFKPTELADVYWKETQETEWAMPRQVYRDAWEHLCPATLYLVKPHFVFSSPHPD